MFVSPDAHIEMFHSFILLDLGWPLVNTGKNKKKGKPWAAKGWPRSLNKGSHLLKMTITMFVLYGGKIGAFVKTARLIQFKRTARQNV